MEKGIDFCLPVAFLFKPGISSPPCAFLMKLSVKKQKCHPWAAMVPLASFADGCAM